MKATREWLSESEAAKRLGLARVTLETWRLRAKPHPPYARFGRAIRYRVDLLDEWAAKRLTTDERA